MSKIKVYRYTAHGGEKAITHNDLVGRTIIRVRRDGISKKRVSIMNISLGLKDNEYHYPPPIGSAGTILLNRITFAAVNQTTNKLQPGEKVEIMYK